jgi:alkylation response protein AidB-like acyl-CoA dehydrogenase
MRPKTKLFAGETLVDAAMSAVQIHGVDGFMTDLLGTSEM